MKLIGKLKDKVEKAATPEEAKEIINDAGMDLNDEEIDQIAGGSKLTAQTVPDQKVGVNRPTRRLLS